MARKDFVITSGMRVDPAPAYKFHVEIQGIIEGWFTECSGLSMEREIFEYKEGGVNDYVHKFPGRTKYSNITLKRGLASSEELWKWYQEGLETGKVKRTNVSIILRDRSGEAIKRWNLESAYPVKWVGPDLKTDSNQVTIETLEIAHHGLTLG